MLVLLSLVAKLAVSVILICIYLLMFLFSQNDRARAKLRDVIRVPLALVGMSDNRLEAAVNGIISLLTAASIPIVVLTTILSIPFEKVSLIHDVHNVTYQYFWNVLFFGEALSIGLLCGSELFEVAIRRRFIKYIFATGVVISLMALNFAIFSLAWDAADILGPMAEITTRYLGVGTDVLDAVALCLVIVIYMGLYVVFYDVASTRWPETTRSAVWPVSIAFVLSAALRFPDSPANSWAVVWLARTGVSVFEFDAGMLYRDGGSGLSRDVVKAVRLFRLAADRGDAQAQAELGVAYYSGEGGLPKDDKEAVRLYRLAADQGNVQGQVNLGVAYEFGEGGLSKNDKEAVRLYRLAADQGNVQAQVNLGVAYESGEGGLSKNDKEAVRLYRLAADQGDALVCTAVTNQATGAAA